MQDGDDVNVAGAWVAYVQWLHFMLQLYLLSYIINYSLVS